MLENAMAGISAVALVRLSTVGLRVTEGIFGWQIHADKNIACVELLPPTGWRQQFPLLYAATRFSVECGLASVRIDYILLNVRLHDG